MASEATVKPKASRRARRRRGKREKHRAVHGDVVRIVELSREGFSPATIAAIIRQPTAFVEGILKLADEVEENQGEGNERAH